MAEHPGVLLALGGGSARGLAHIGVLHTLEAAGIPIKGIAGTSIGAIVGGLWSAGVLDQYEVIMRGVDGQSVLWFLDPVLPTSGFFEGNRIDALHKALLGDMRIEELRMPYCAVAGDIKTGEEVRMRFGLLSEAMRASIAIPGIFHPFKIDGHWLVDGGVVAPLPIAAARDFGNLPVVAVNLQTDLFDRPDVSPGEASMNIMSIPTADTREALERLAKSPELRSEVRIFMMETVKLGQAAGLRLARRTERLWRRFAARGVNNIPGLFTVVNEGFAMLQTRLAAEHVESMRPEVVLEPKLPGVGMFDYGRADEIIAEGARVTQEALDSGAFDRLGPTEGLRGRLSKIWKAG